MGLILERRTGFERWDSLHEVHKNFADLLFNVVVSAVAFGYGRVLFLRLRGN